MRQRLTAAFIASVERNDPAAFPDAVDAILRQASQGWDDAAIWQAAFSVVSDELPALTERWPEAGQRDLARDLLEEVRSVHRGQHMAAAPAAMSWISAGPSTGSAC